MGIAEFINERRKEIPVEAQCASVPESPDTGRIDIDADGKVISNVLWLEGERKTDIPVSAVSGDCRNEDVERTVGSIVHSILPVISLTGYTGMDRYIIP